MDILCKKREVASECHKTHTQKKFWRQTLKLASLQGYFYLSIKAYLGVLTKKLFEVGFYIVCLYLHFCGFQVLC